MHSNLEPEIWKGTRKMKYVINHPRLFRKFDNDELLKAEDNDSDDDEIKTEEELDDGLYIRVTLAFLLGFF